MGAYPGPVETAPADPGIVGTTERIEVERVVAGGHGLGRSASGRVVFVPGALPGETVEVRIVEARRDLAWARLEDVVVASSARRTPPCPALTAGCGGCDWQHVEPAQQLGHKVAIAQESLLRTARLADIAVEPGGAVPPLGYRTTMRFAVAPDGRLGLRRAASADVVPLDHCPVAHPLLAEMLPVVRARSGSAGAAGGTNPPRTRGRQQRSGRRAASSAPEVSLRVGVATGTRTAWCTAPDVRLEGLPDGVRQGADASVIEHVLGVPLRVSAASFFQSGPAAAELLARTVAEVLAADLAAASQVVDLYGGVGLFAATVVPDDAEVTVVEGAASSCADARVNLAGRAAQVVHRGVEAWRGVGRSDVVIADPSRRGLGRDAVGTIAATGAPVLGLVACDPVSLARDAVLLAEQGFRLERAVALDLFPETHHVEVVARFVR